MDKGTVMENMINKISNMSHKELVELRDRLATSNGEKKHFLLELIDDMLLVPDIEMAVIPEPIDMGNGE